MNREDMWRIFSYFLPIPHNGGTTEEEICKVIGLAKREALCAGLDEYLANEKVQEAFLSAAERRVNIKMILNNKEPSPEWLKELQEKYSVEVRYPLEKVRTRIYVDKEHIFMKDS